MKKKIIFMCINMNIGGTEKALLNMISEISLKEYEVTILMLEKYGGFLGDIPKGVKVRYLKDYKEIKPLLNNQPLHVSKKLLCECKVIQSLSTFGLNLIGKIIGERSLYYKYLLRNSIETEVYDIAVAYAGPMEFITYYVLKKINANKKVQWIHFDVSKIGFNSKFSREYYEKFDKVFVVSDEGKNKLLEKVPQLNNVEVKYNVIPIKQIKKLANEGTGFNDNFDGKRILTVGRLAKEKGQDLTIEVMKMLKEEGKNIRWYCIGDGVAKKEYEDLVKRYDLEDDYIFLGAKANPYTYMKECDIYVQPSRHEGFCITLAEVKCFNKNIITTDFVGAKEQLKNYEKQFIVKIDYLDIYQKTLKFI